jgi:Uma2 family endonuclease
VTTLTIELPVREDQTAFNLRRWEEVLADPYYADLPGRAETDRHGDVVMSPPAAPWHSGYQYLIARRLGDLLPEGQPLTECAISTADGVRACDVAWLSRGRIAELRQHVCLPNAPEICVEIISPGNSPGQMQEKRALYFAAGATEVWFCDENGKMTFHTHAASPAEPGSQLCPQFPSHVQL